LFSINKGIDDENVSMAKAFTGGNNVYYTTQRHDTIIKQVDGSLGQYLINYKQKIDWILSDETKLIDSYLCYKATSTLIVINSSGTFKFPVIAWYCPSIPFNYGPNGYNGLPGIILEFQERNISYGAIKVKLNRENVLIPKPNKGKIISEDQYKNIITNQREAIKNQN
jgi:GLPGLI family protein